MENILGTKTGGTNEAAHEVLHSHRAIPQRIKKLFFKITYIFRNEKLILNLGQRTVGHRIKTDLVLIGKPTESFGDI